MSLKLREIPEGSVEIQTGLWLYTSTYLYNETPRERRELISSEGYCFYDIRDEVCDSEGNLIPEDEVMPNQRTYFQYTILGIYDVVTNYISVKIEDDFNI